MINIIEKILYFELEQAFYFDWQLDIDENYIILIDVCNIIKKYASLKLEDFLDEFVYQLNDSTGKNWQLSENKLVSSDGDEIKIYGNLNNFKMDINGLSTAKYYIRDEKYEGILYKAYRSLFNAELNANINEIFSELQKLKRAYTNDSKKISSEISELVNFFVSEASKIQHQKAKAELKQNALECNPQTYINECEKRLELLNVDKFQLGIAFNKNVIYDSKLIAFGFDLDDDLHVTIKGDKGVYNKLKSLVASFAKFISEPELSKENLTNFNSPLNYDAHLKQMQTIINEINNCLNFLLEVKKKMICLASDELKAKHIEFSANNLSKILVFKQIDEQAYPLLRYMIKVLSDLNNAIKHKDEVKHSCGDSIILTSIKIEADPRFWAKSNKKEKLTIRQRHLDNSTLLLDDLLAAVEETRNFLNECAMPTANSGVGV